MVERMKDLEAARRIEAVNRPGATIAADQSGPVEIPVGPLDEAADGYGSFGRGAEGVEDFEIAGGIESEGSPDPAGAVPERGSDQLAARFEQVPRRPGAGGGGEVSQGLEGPGGVDPKDRPAIERTAAARRTVEVTVRSAE